MLYQIGFECVALVIGYFLLDILLHITTKDFEDKKNNNSNVSEWKSTCNSSLVLVICIHVYFFYLFHIFCD